MWIVANREAKIGDPEKRVIGRAVLSRGQERMESGILVEAELAEELGIIFRDWRGE